VQSMQSNMSTTAARLIAMAVSLVGDAGAVRNHMRCSEADFLAYCEGQKELNAGMLEAVVGLIVQEQGKLIAKNREMLTELRKRRDAEKPAS
jgi:hypothetical protein